MSRVVKSRDGELNIEGDQITIEGDTNINTTTGVAIKAGSGTPLEVTLDDDSNLLSVDDAAQVTIGNASNSGSINLVGLDVDNGTQGESSVLLSMENTTGYAGIKTYKQSTNTMGLDIISTYNGAEVLAARFMSKNDTSYFMIDSPGSLGLSVVGSGASEMRINRGSAAGTRVTFFQAGTGTNNFRIDDNGRLYVRTANWGTGGTAVGVSSGFLTLSPSSEKYKENIKDCTLDSSKVYDIKVREFDYVASKGGAHDFGPIAEEANLVLPEIVWKEEDENGNLVPESIRESKVVWLLLEEMKKLKSRIDELESKL